MRHATCCRCHHLPHATHATHATRRMPHAMRCTVRWGVALPVGRANCVRAHPPRRRCGCAPMPLLSSACTHASEAAATCAGDPCARDPRSRDTAENEPSSVRYLCERPAVLLHLVSGYMQQSVALHHGTILREAIRHEQLARLLLADATVFPTLCQCIESAHFDVASDAYAARHRSRCPCRCPNSLRAPPHGAGPACWPAVPHRYAECRAALPSCRARWFDSVVLTRRPLASQLCDHPHAAHQAPRPRRLFPRCQLRGVLCPVRRHRTSSHRSLVEGCASDSY